MPKGPQGRKREADVIGNAVLVMKIATGEVKEPHSKKSKSGLSGRTAKKAARRPR